MLTLLFEDLKKYIIYIYICMWKVYWRVYIYLFLLFFLIMKQYEFARHINTYFSVAQNMLFSIFLYYAFSLLIFLSIFVFKMRKALYSLLFYMCICLYIYTPVFMASLKEIEVGNYFICNLKDYPTGNCSVNHDYNKTVIRARQ